MAYVVDFRSDTVTKPCADMRKAMFEAEVGDDVFNDDPTVKMMAHCQGRGEEVLLGDQCHIMLYEQGGISQFAGVNPRTVVNKPDGTFDLHEAKSKIRMDNIHFPRTRLICIENTHNFAGGRVIPMAFIQKVKELADSHHLLVHLDGARLMNAVIATGTTPDAITKYCDSVSICLSKGLGAPVGSCLAGNKEFIKRARRHRKALGGGMRQAGVLAAAGLVALEKGIPRLKTDHENAKRLAQGIIDLKCSSVTCDLAATETNMVYLYMGEGVSVMSFYRLCDTVLEGEEEELGQAIKVRICPMSDRCIRAAIHHHITAEHVAMALKKIAFVDKLFQNGEVAKHLPKD
ncbi:probable low-specificity L-threonine aldolase 1 isoform X2 [Acanthaster planci]|uniref:Probable low-specificity L-threonine aldolase 1 isoform X2 n=1 Tax=Acanthaster planci TaxID=133434 RepID=A0A8B7ZJ90_ACAPL|nr:probable low-specificity L-threonine aldolase 1 isoform X2 [Acanthaster planci]